MRHSPLFVLAAFCCLPLLSEGREYCWEPFNATCLDDEVILIQAALYGRMRVGSCITRNYLIGCNVDVISYMDTRCSGRKSCVVALPDSELHKRLQTCPSDVLAYLDANYTCQKVAYHEAGACVGNEALLVEAGHFTEGYISSLIARKTGQGSERCPWRLKVNGGQKINITLLDYSAPSYLDSDSALSAGTDTGRGVTERNLCHRYAIVREKQALSADIPVCGGGRRKHFVYHSEGNEVEVTILSSDPDAHFLLRYQVVGCADFAPVENGWTVRRGDHLTLGCNYTGHVWHLVCDGHNWVGDVKNCSSPHNGGDDTGGSSPTYGKDGHQNDDDGSMPFGLIIAIVIGVALGVVIGIVMLIVVLSCQHKLRRHNGGLPHGSDGIKEARNDADKERMLRSGEYGYAHVWELQQLRAQGQDGETDPKDAAFMLTNTLSQQPDFGSHLIKYPHSNQHGLSREHSYESPRFITRDMGSGEYRTGTAPMGCYHHFHADHVPYHSGTDGILQDGAQTAPVPETQLTSGDGHGEVRYTN